MHIHRLLFVEPDTVGGKTHDLVPGPEVFDGVRRVSIRTMNEIEREGRWVGRSWIFRSFSFFKEDFLTDSLMWVDMRVYSSNTV